MNFAQAMVALSDGKFVKRHAWEICLVEDNSGIHFASPNEPIGDDNYYGPWDFERSDYEATDWEIVTP